MKNHSNKQNKTLKRKNSISKYFYVSMLIHSLQKSKTISEDNY